MYWAQTTLFLPLFLLVFPNQLKNLSFFLCLMMSWKASPNYLKTSLLYAEINYIFFSFSHLLFHFPFFPSPPLFQSSEVWSPDFEYFSLIFCDFFIFFILYDKARACVSAAQYCASFLTLLLFHVFRIEYCGFCLKIVCKLICNYVSTLSLTRNSPMSRH